MGRQAYLTRIAFGRSAFEPAQPTSSTSEYLQQASAQQERAQNHGRRFREAQNDVLASIGVVERRRSPSQGLPGSYQDRLRELEDEDTAGFALATTYTLTENVCTWWVGSLRERILTFHRPVFHSFSQFVALEKHRSGRSLIYSGLPSHILSQLCTQVLIHAAHAVRPVERLVAEHGVSRTRRLYRRWRRVLDVGFRISLELLFYPLSYYSSVQRLGLAPARPLLPPLRSFVPFTVYSPLMPFSAHHDVLASGFVKAFLTSPFVFVCLSGLLESWVYEMISEPIEAMIVRPRNPDMTSSEMPNGHMQRTIAIPGLRRKSPKFLWDTISKLLSLVGWADTTTSTASPPTSSAAQNRETQESDTIDVGGSQASNINTPEVRDGLQSAPVAPRHGVTETVTVPMSSLSEMLPDPTFPSPPLSPTASQASHDDGDPNNDAHPRIRITARGAWVQMEVRLPPQVLSSHTELAESGPPSPMQRDTAAPVSVQTPSIPYHRVTHLSSEPSSMLGSICKAQIVTLVLLPLKLVTLKLIASHYMAGRPEYAGPQSVYNALISPSGMGRKYLGTLVSHLALCGGIELALDLTLWGCECWTVTWLGTRAFGWGAL